MKYLALSLILSIFIIGCLPAGTIYSNDTATIGTDVYVVRTEEITYQDGQGFLAKPEREGNYPGIIMIHEWWGLNNNIKEMAERLAEEGYVVLAVDLFDGQVANDPEGARALVGKVDDNAALQNLQSAADYLRREEGVQKMGVLGWCFGGGQALKLSLSGEDLDATVIYYGNLITDEGQLSKISWPVLGIFGREDQSIPVSDVNRFDTALDGLGIQNEIYIYDGVGHAFANPSNPNHDPAKTADAWQKTMVFLDRTLKR